MTYKPLPGFLYIDASTIEGQGLFTREHINTGHILGITHVQDSRFEDGYIRTPLGAFFNHSDTPNCEAYTDGDFIKLKAIEEILPGDELTAFYWLYKVKTQ